MMFAIAARILSDGGLQATRDFIAIVNAHIEALRRWEQQRERSHRQLVLRWTPEPTSEAMLLTAQRRNFGPQNLASLPFPRDEAQRGRGPSSIAGQPRHT